MPNIAYFKRDFRLHGDFKVLKSVCLKLYCHTSCIIRLPTGGEKVDIYNV